MTQIRRSSEKPTALWVAVGVLAVIGGFTVLGWLFSALWALVRVGVLVAIVVVLVVGVRSLLRR